MKKHITQIKKLFTVAFPVLVAQLAQTLMGAVDTVMTGQVSPLDVAAVALGQSIWLPSVIVIGGAIMAVPAHVAHAFGSNKTHEIRPLIHQTLYMALACSLVVMFVLYTARYGLSLIDIDTRLKVHTVGYLSALMWGAPAFLMFQSLRAMTEGMSITKPSMLIGFTGFLVNIPANYVFIYGGLGVPAMGGIGTGVATALVYWVMLITLAGYITCSKKLKQIELFSTFSAVDWSIQRRLFYQGLPIALAVFLEVAVFAFISLALTSLGDTDVIAGNQIAVNLTTVTMMIPIAIGTSVTVRVGYFLGQNQLENARNTISSGVIMTCVSSSLIMTGIYFLSGPIAELYSSDSNVQLISENLLILAALFQLPNAIQTIYVAGLRGFKDTLPILYVALTCYWGVGMVVGCALGLTNLIVPKMGASGLWIGFIVGLLIAAVTLHQRLIKCHFEKKSSWLVASR